VHLAALRDLSAALAATDAALRRVARRGGDVTGGDVAALLRIDALLQAVRARLGPHRGTLDPMPSEELSPFRVDGPQDVQLPTPAHPDPALDELASALKALEGGERAQDLRAHLLLRAVDLAQGAGMIAGFVTDGLSVRAVIELPTGRVSYPVPPAATEAISWNDQPGSRRGAVDAFAAQIGGADPQRAMYELVRAASRWINALPPASWQEISGVAIVRTPTGTTISLLPPGFTPPGPTTRAPGEAF
jgi:hypothetical protein